MIENKIERIANATVKSYINDGYKLQWYEFNEISQLAIYRIIHSNGNNIKVVGDVIENKVKIFLNGKINKTISL